MIVTRHIPRAEFQAAIERGITAALDPSRGDDIPTDADVVALREVGRTATFSLAGIARLDDEPAHMCPAEAIGAWDKPQWWDFAFAQTFDRAIDRGKSGDIIRLVIS